MADARRPLPELPRQALCPKTRSASASPCSRRHNSRCLVASSHCAGRDDSTISLAVSNICETIGDVPLLFFVTVKMGPWSNQPSTDTTDPEPRARLKTRSTRGSSSIEVELYAIRRPSCYAGTEKVCVLRPDRAGQCQSTCQYRHSSASRWAIRLSADGCIPW